MHTLVDISYDSCHNMSTRVIDFLLLVLKISHYFHFNCVWQVFVCFSLFFSGFFWNVWVAFYIKNTLLLAIYWILLQKKLILLLSKTRNDISLVVWKRPNFFQSIKHPMILYCYFLLRNASLLGILNASKQLKQYCKL